MPMQQTLRDPGGCRNNLLPSLNASRYNESRSTSSADGSFSIHEEGCGECRGYNQLESGSRQAGAGNDVFFRLYVACEV